MGLMLRILKSLSMNKDKIEQEMIETKLLTKQTTNALKSKKIVVKGKK